MHACEVARTIRLIARTIRRDANGPDADADGMSSSPPKAGPVLQPPAITPHLSSDPYVAQHEGLVQVHLALGGALRTVASTPAETSLADLVPQALAAGNFLLGHHHAESAVLFPGLRRLGRLRSADVAFLDACDREHRALHDLCERLLGAAGAPHPAAPAIISLAGEVATLLSAHVAEEEAGLAPERLRAMIDLAGLEEIGRELEEIRRQARR